MKLNLNMLKQSLTILMMVIFAQSYAQVGINTTTPHPSAALDINSDTTGVLIPRMDKTSRVNIPSPANSLLVYDTDYKQFFFYINGVWYPLNAIKTTFTPNGGNIDTVSYVHGKVGIGLTNPSQRLEVLGNTLIRGNIISTGSISATSASISGPVTSTSTSTGNITCANVSSQNINANGTVTATTFVGNGTIPVGGIIMWSGSPSTIPAGWALCDGANGTPNLANQFVLAYGTGTGPVRSTGGQSQVRLTIANLPPHQHGFSDIYAAQNDVATGSSRTRASDYTSTTSTTTDGSEKGLARQPFDIIPPYYVLAYIMRIQ